MSAVRALQRKRRVSNATRENAPGVRLRLVNGAEEASYRGADPSAASASTFGLLQSKTTVSPLEHWLRTLQAQVLVVVLLMHTLFAGEWTHSASRLAPQYDRTAEHTAEQSALSRTVTAHDETAALNDEQNTPPPAARSTQSVRGQNEGEAFARRRHVLHTTLDPPHPAPAEDERVGAQPYPSLELRRAGFNEGGSGDYTRDGSTEVVYLFANGVRLARVVNDPLQSGGPSADLRVFFELGDHLGSTSVALDKATSELVERATYQAYGGAESDYRPEAWGSFREDYRFTGKEEDVEVGLVYLGKRFYNPLLQRWVSADPLKVHAAASGEPNLYAYVSGRALLNIDPLGLQDTEFQCHPDCVTTPELQPLQPPPTSENQPNWVEASGPDRNSPMNPPGRTQTVELIVMGQYTDARGQHPYGHVAMSVPEVRDPSNQIVYDFGRYGQTWRTWRRNIKCLDRQRYDDFG